mmetsp:Transcript_33908/g.46971  ORF Transcript_33908/g.46971 Transcript_33908/m.46971 type:complete len:246 (-) Transcript_33908:218-955(-)
MEFIVRRVISSIALRGLYVAWVAILLSWIALDEVKWFHSEQNKQGDSVFSFNWHPVCMSFSVLICMSEAILAYRVYEKIYNVEHKIAKISHASLQGTALILMGLGLFFVFENHAFKSIDHLYSAHSWLGVGVAGFMALQALQGSLVYLATDVTAVRAAMMPLHKFVGLATYLTAVLVICMGLQEKSGFLKGAGACKTDPYCAPLIYANVLTLLAVCIAGLTTSMLHDFEGQSLVDETSEGYHSIR